MLRLKLPATSKKQLLDFFSSNRPTTMSKRDLVAIIGTTGVGKSQLAVELALQLGSSAEIINSDSMQLYKGLNVITNKITNDEMKGVKHHLMDVLEPNEQDYAVGQFQTDALKIIDQIHAKDSTPIIVGGTSYYLQNLVFTNNLAADVPLPPRSTSPALFFTPAPVAGTRAPPPNDLIKSYADIAHFSCSLRNAILSLPPDLLALFYALPSFPATSTPNAFSPLADLSTIPAPFRDPEKFAAAVYAILVHVDEASAKRWHWRDIRKVRRSLEIVWQGRRWKDIVEGQEEKREDGEGSRFRTLIFWLYSDMDVLKQRLDDRVDRMVEGGLMDEIMQLEASTKVNGVRNLSVDLTSGIYQAIGYKEFEPYLSSLSPGAKIDKEDVLFKSGLERMKISTNQYAKSQIRWIRVKLLPAINKSMPRGDVEIFLLDATDLKNWDQTVKAPAIDLLSKFIHKRPLPSPTSLSSIAATQLASTSSPLEPISYKLCPICTGDNLSQPYLVDERDMEKHTKSRSHLRNVRGLEPPIDWSHFRENSTTRERREKKKEREKRGARVG